MGGGGTGWGWGRGGGCGGWLEGLGTLSRKFRGDAKFHGSVPLCNNNSLL